ncbi:MAG: hypothetical protein LBE17_02310 [Treponema sp.]|nr:hypothetical protein [Treponema sp.]
MESQKNNTRREKAPPLGGWVRGPSDPGSSGSMEDNDGKGNTAGGEKTTAEIRQIVTEPLSGLEGHKNRRPTRTAG